MKKFLSLTLALIMTLMFIAGCSSNTDAQQTATPTAQANATATPSPTEAPKAEVKNSDLVVLNESLQAEEYGIAFKKGNTQLHDAVISTLDTMLSDGAAGKISEKWFGKDVIMKGNPVTPQKFPAGKTTFIMGLDDAFPPMGFRDDKNNIMRL